MGRLRFKAAAGGRAVKATASQIKPRVSAAVAARAKKLTKTRQKLKHQSWVSKIAGLQEAKAKNEVQQVVARKEGKYAIVGDLSEMQQALDAIEPPPAAAAAASAAGKKGKKHKAAPAVVSKAMVAAVRAGTQRVQSRRGRQHVM
jgi:hypothetical protein